MKILIILVLSFLSFNAFSQQHVFKVSAQKQILSIHLNEDNSNKKITIDSKEKIANVQRLSIRGLAPALDNGWVRTFQVTGSDEGEAVVTINDDKEPGVFNYGLKDLVEKLKPGTYKIFTLAIPKDAAKAAELKPKRILVATLEVV
jgi:hypothetical protein